MDKAFAAAVLAGAALALNADYEQTGNYSIPKIVGKVLDYEFATYCA